MNVLIAIKLTWFGGDQTCDVYIENPDDSWTYKSVEADQILGVCEGFFSWYDRKMAQVRASLFIQAKPKLHLLEPL